MNDAPIRCVAFFYGHNRGDFMKTHLKILFAALTCTVAMSLAQAQPPGGVPRGGNPFTRIAELEALVAALETRIAAIEANSVLALDGKLTYNDTTMKAVFSGINVQVVNGVGTTDSINGAGNLIVGYDQARIGDSDKTGSHNVVIGDQHDYTSFGGLVTGFGNTISGGWASVSGGVYNTAEGIHSSVSGGFNNTASGRYSSVSGGHQNRASVEWSSISGGYSNRARGLYSSVSGGNWNQANGFGSSVSGGFDNIASGESSSVTGGFLNTAEDTGSSVSGGDSNIASATASSVSGGANNTASGDRSSVSGGYGCETVLYSGWAVGDPTTTTGCVTSN